MAWFKSSSVGVIRRVSREGDGGLPNVIAWVGFDFFDKLTNLEFARGGADQHAVTTRFANGFDHQFFGAGEYLCQTFFVPTQ